MEEDSEQLLLPASDNQHVSAALKVISHSLANLWEEEDSSDNSNNNNNLAKHNQQQQDLGNHNPLQQLQQEEPQIEDSTK